MKVLLVVGPNEGKLASATARLLKEKKSYSFAAITHHDVQKKSLKNDKVEYDAIVSQEEIEPSNTLDKRYLEYIQRNVLSDFPLGKVIVHDRHLLSEYTNSFFARGYISDQKRYKKLESRFKKVEKIMEKWGAEKVLYTGIDTSPNIALVSYLMAEHYGVECVVPHHLRISNYVSLSHSIFNEHILEDEKTSDIKGLSLKEKPDYVNSKRKGKSEIRYLDKIKNFVVNIAGGNSTEIAKRYIDKLYHKYKRTVNFKRRYEDDQVPEKYIYFPLHVEPERALLLWGPDFRDQEYLLKVIGQNLPYKVKLAVKEHPGMGPTRDIYFYKRISQYPNVKLISEDVSSSIIARKSLGVMTVSGTSALESALIGTPSAVFGNVYFAKYFDSIDQIKSPAQIKNFIEKCINKKDVYNESQVSKFKKLLAYNAIKVGLKSLKSSDSVDEVYNNESFKKYIDCVNQRIKSG